VPILLILLLLLPLLAAAVVAALGKRNPAWARWLSLAVAIVCLAISLILAANFSALRASQPVTRFATFQPEYVPGSPGQTRDLDGKLTPPDPHRTSWDLLRFATGRPSPGDGNEPGQPAVQFYIGLDGLNVWLVVLTALLMVSSVLVSWTAIQERINEFYGWLLVLETAMIGVFVSFDIILFYVFFELTLVPLFFVIGIWGGPQRRYAARKFFIYTLGGSLVTLLGVIAVVLLVNSREGILTFSIPQLVTETQRLSAQYPEVAQAEFWIFLALIAGLAIKVPLVPLHTWLPLAHVEAPTAGSVLLAGILLKIGAYGFLRLCLPLTPHASYSVGLPLIGVLAVIGVVYGSFCALGQTDIKKLVAYSSVAHMGLVMLGIFALNAGGMSGGLVQMINHGLSTGALFLLVGMLYERYHTRMMADYGGMTRRLPMLSWMFVFIVLTSIGLPGLNGFIGEVMCLMGIYDAELAHGRWPALAVFGSLGIVLGAWYLLTLLMRVFFGPFHEPEVLHDDVDEKSHASGISDLNPREWLALAPIAVACLLIGVYSQPFFDAVKRDMAVVDRIVEPRETNIAPPMTVRGETHTVAATVTVRGD